MQHGEARYNNSIVLDHSDRRATHCDPKTDDKTAQRDTKVRDDSIISRTFEAWEYVDNQKKDFNIG